MCLLSLHQLLLVFETFVTLGNHTLRPEIHLRKVNLCSQGRITDTINES